jgi:hypothetical protein
MGKSADVAARRAPASALAAAIAAPGFNRPKTANAAMLRSRWLAEGETRTVVRTSTFTSIGNTKRAGSTPTME